MIDIDYSDKASIVRSNIGDPNQDYVSDSTINSALISTNNNEIKASVLVMETMLAWFSTLADESRTGQVEYKYRNLYERYKSKLQDFKSANTSKKSAGIILGGVSLAEKNRVAVDVDRFSMYDMDDYQRLRLEDGLIREDELKDY